MRALMLLLLLGCSTLVSAGGVYKWVDEQGRVHYGERPPAKVKAQEMELKDRPLSSTPPEDDAVRQEREQNLLRAFQEERENKKAEKAKTEEEEAKRERNCHVARDRLRRYESAGALYDLDGSGERRLLNDGERSAAEQSAREQVAKWCD